MRLTRITVKNFRSIGSGENNDGISIDLDRNNIIFLVGVNNSGKSSMLTAYDYFFNDLIAKDDDFHGKLGHHIEIEAILIAETEDDYSSEEAKYYIDNEVKTLRMRKIWQSVGKPPLLEIWNPQSSTWSVLEKNESKIKSKIKSNLMKSLPKPIWVRGLASPDEITTQIQSLIKNTVVQHFEESEEYQTLQDQMRNASEAIQDFMVKDEYTKKIASRINETIQSVFPRIKLSIQNSGSSANLIQGIEKNTEIKAIEEGSPEVGLDYHGHGVRRQFVLSAYKNCSSVFDTAKKKGKKKRSDFDFEPSIQNDEQMIPKTKILLIEEPELFLHPSAVRDTQSLLYDLAKNSDYQILCATHSPIIIDLSKKHSSLVRMVSYPIRLEGDCENKVVYKTVGYQAGSQLFEEDEMKWLRMYKEFDPYMNEVFFTQRALLVEGDTEAVVARIILDKMGRSSDLFVVNCRGKKTIPLFQKILYHFRIPYVVLHDADNPEDTTNEDIWNEIEKANNTGLSARRFVFDSEYESAHNYSIRDNDSKPYMAYKELQRWLGVDGKGLTTPETQKKPIVIYLSNAVEDNQIEHKFNQNWLKQNTCKGHSNRKVSSSQMSLL